MPFHFRCPNCNAKLEAEDEWEGQETTCPQCAHRVVITRSPSSPPGDQDDKARRRFHWFGGGRKYIWGRLYIFFIWIIVGLVFCAGIVYILFLCIQHSSAKEMRRAELWQTIPVLQEKQAEFSKHLQDTIDLLAEKKTLGSNRGTPQVTGFQLPDSIRQKEIIFNDELDSVHAVETSLQAAGESIKTIKEIEHCLEKNLRDQLRSLRGLIEQQARSAHQAAPLEFSARRSAAIRADFSRKVSFYLSEREKFNAIQTIRREVSKVSNLYSDNRRLKGDLKRLLLFLDFIQDNLLSRNVTQQLKQLQGNFESQHPQDAKPRKVIPGEKEYKNILQQLALLYLAWVNESDQGEWYIATEAKSLQNALQSHLNKIRQEERISSSELRNLLFNCLKTLFYCIVLSFILLVIADILRAHFDCAENTLKK